MKVAVMNFSGNVGKTTVAQQMLLPRIPGAEYRAVESINSGDGDADSAIRGKQFGDLQEYLMTIDHAVVDVGASNVEDFVKNMQLFRGSHEEFDYFMIPTVKDDKQIRDTVATIDALHVMGVEPKRIRTIFNKLELDEKVEDAFWQIFSYHEAKKRFTLRPAAFIQASELYQRLRLAKRSLQDVLYDETDYKAKLRETTDPDEKQKYAQLISIRRLAYSANENLDAAFKAVFK